MANEDTGPRIIAPWEERNKGRESVLLLKSRASDTAPGLETASMHHPTEVVS